MGKEVTGYLLELSWEVCNKVGGIYAVLASKAAQMVEKYGQDYIAIGPYTGKSEGEFQEKPIPQDLQAAFSAVKEQGIICHFGSWLVGGQPNAILIDYSGFAKNNNDIKKGLWESFQIDSLGTNYHDVDEPVVWATAAAVLAIEITRKARKQCVLHCHEWLAGAAILKVRKEKEKIATVFTTHATMLGRTIAGSGGMLYENLEKIDPDKAAYEHGMHTKHQIEKACANNASIFSTVSEITGLEAAHLLGKKPDVLLPNGLDMEQFPSVEEAAIKHATYERKVKEFLIPYFFPHYTFDLDQTLIYFLFGRQEIHNKGIDVFIDALKMLNDELKKKKSPKTIVAFFFVPGAQKGLRPSLLARKAEFEDIHDAIMDSAKEIEERLVYAVLAGNTCNEDYLLGSELSMKLRKSVSRLLKKDKNLPPLSTHQFEDEQNEPIMRLLREAGLENRKEDKVKIVYFPTYLNGADGLLDLDYYEGILGGHLGVFPSYYEPWGYTPLEAGALSIPAVTTDLAGFGRYIAQETKNAKEGITVIKRMGRPDGEVAADLATFLSLFAAFKRDERVKQRLTAKQLSAKADWKILIEHYFDAHQKAAGKEWS